MFFHYSEPTKNVLKLKIREYNTDSYIQTLQLSRKKPSAIKKLAEKSLIFHHFLYKMKSQKIEKVAKVHKSKKLHKVERVEKVAKVKKTVQSQKSWKLTLEC